MNPIEELWSIIQQDIDKHKPAIDLAQLQAQLQQAWSRIEPSVLSGLVASMPVRVRIGMPVENTLSTNTSGEFVCFVVVQSYILETSKLMPDRVFNSDRHRDSVAFL